MDEDAGLLTRASGELVERLLVGCSKQEAGAAEASSKPVAIDKADDTTMR